MTEEGSELARRLKKAVKKRQAIEERFAVRRYEGRSKGGRTKVLISGNFQLIGVLIHSETDDPVKPEQLEQDIKLAYNRAVSSAEDELRIKTRDLQSSVWILDALAEEVQRLCFPFRDPWRCRHPNPLL